MRIDLASLHRALAEGRLETARRIGLALVADEQARTPADILGLHDALAAISDIRAASDLLEQHSARLAEDPFAVSLRLAEDALLLAGEHHYRTSDAARRGIGLEHYLDDCRARAEQHFANALARADTEERRQALRASCERCRRPIPAELSPRTAPDAVATPDLPPGSLRGRIIDSAGPVPRVTVTLGLEVDVRHDDPATYVKPQMHYLPEIGPLRKLVATTDADGVFTFAEVPPGRHAFLAVTLDPERHAIATRFLARDLVVTSGQTTDVGALTVSDWRSAPARPSVSPHPTAREIGGVTWRKVSDTRLHNPFYYDFRRQLLKLPLPAGFDPARETLRVEIEPDRAEPFQIVDQEVALMAALPARAERHIALYAGPLPALAPAEPAPRLGDGFIELDTRVARFRIPGPDAAPDAPPLSAVRGVDRRWRGSGRLVLPAGVRVLRRTAEIVRHGPVLTEACVAYVFENGAACSFHLTALAGEAFLSVREVSTPLADAAFEFSLPEFSGGRSYLHWVRETHGGARHWHSLAREDKQIARLPESVPWWIPPQGFAFALTPDGLDERDYIGVFTRRRGEWIDREFERIAQGPVDEDGRENRELDWPFPEMVGSSISHITAHTRGDGDVFFRFGFFDGERQWGLLVSDLAANDGLRKEIAEVQHASSSPRLQEFKDWHFDEPDTRSRPQVVANRDQLVGLRAKTRHPLFAPIWEKIRRGNVTGPSQGLAFAVEGDPLIAWRKRTELLHVAPVRARMTLLGRDWSDMYSPVGGRPITPWAEDYDLIAASGVFTEEEEREVRAFFILMGHLYAEPDFMNWRFNSRNANFEADRTDIVGAVGLVFDGHPDSAKFIDHVVELTKKSLLVYCTPGSGKWYENPACYYLQASKCRMNLLFHLARHGHVKITDIPRLREFLRWGILLLMPPNPVAYALMRDGTDLAGHVGSEAWDRAEKVRKIPPIGDHAALGRWLPEHYAIFGKFFRDIDPAFARELSDAYHAANADGLRLATGHTGEPVAQLGEHIFHDATEGATFGNLPLFFSVIDEADIPPAVPALPLASRRLEGFGAVFRHAVGTDREGYVLLKQGPGGYRYQRTEGGFIFFADGHPLVFEGGEAGETWRHSTLSFYDERMPLAAGRVERCFLSPELHFSQGVHPGAIAPGEPVFLSDSCEHTLVEESHRRFRQEPPGVVRSLAWLDGRTLIVHDAIDLPPDIPSHWHLQVVGGAPSVDAVSGWRFPGRFGTDLQVLFPDQHLAETSAEELPIYEYRGAPSDWFAMRHLQVSAPGARNYLAVLQPLSEGESPVTAEAIRHADRIIGVIIRGAAREDRVWFGRGPVSDTGPAHAFAGTSGVLLARDDHRSLVLFGAGRLRHGDHELVSHGPAALLRIDASGLRLTAEGRGTVEIRSGDLRQTISVADACDLHFPHA